MNHGVFKRLEEILLKFEVGQLFFLQKSHGKLSQRIEGEETNFSVRVTGDLREFNVSDCETKAVIKSRDSPD